MPDEDLDRASYRTRATAPYHRAMAEQERSDPPDAARALVKEKVPTARGAILAGSVVTGGATDASDLDIVVIADDPDAPYRRSIHFEGWPAELSSTPRRRSTVSGSGRTSSSGPGSP